MRENKTVRTNAKCIIFIFLIFSGILLSLFYIPLFPTSSKEKVTDGKITFMDFNSNPLTGTIKIGGTGIPGGQHENINSIVWAQVPNAIIDFNAFDTKGISITFQIDEDSPNGRVIIEDHGSDKPVNISLPAPGETIKYVEIRTINVSFADADVTFLYKDVDIQNIDENNLTLYIFNRDAKEWQELTAMIDTNNNTISATVDVMSVFAFGSHIPGISTYDIQREDSDSYALTHKILSRSKPAPGTIEVRDFFDKQVETNITIYNKNKTLKKEAKGYILSTDDLSDNGELEIDALKTKNAALKLTIKSAGSGKIILDDLGKTKPVSVALPDAIKYMEIGVQDINFSSALVTIQYSQADLKNVIEDNLKIFHWDGKIWEELPTTIDKINKTLSAETTSLSPFGVSTSYGYINAMVARTVILDEGYAWDTRNWENGQSVTQYVYGVVISNYGLPIQGANVSGNYTAANGSTNQFPFSGTTDVYGEFNFSTNLDNQVRIGQSDNNQGPNEGNWTVNINVTYNGTKTIMTRNFTLGEYGCGRSGAGCHAPGGTAVAAKGGAMSANSAYSNDPYIQGVIADSSTGQSAHMVYKTAGNEHKAPTDTAAGRNCETCHRGYNQKGYNATNSYRNNATALSTNDLHEVNNVHCNDCHGNRTIGGVVQRTYEVPQCYNSTCHSNTSNIPKTWVQSRNTSYSWNQHAHDTDQTIGCIFCHGPYHNISKPNVTYAAIDSTPNGVTESEYCLNNCHKNQQYHNGTLQCTVCHSQAAHEIRYFNSAGNYTYNTTQSPDGTNVGRSNAGKCSTCHQKPYFAKLLNNTRNPGNNYTPVNGSYSGGVSGSKLVADPIRHSAASNNGTKWGNYWNASNDSDACFYCHGVVYNNVGLSFTTSALGHVWQFMGNNTVNSSITSSTYWCASCHWQGYTSGTKTYDDMVSSFLDDNHIVPPEITGNATYANQSISGYTNHNSFGKSDSSCFGCHKGNLTASATITDFMHNVSLGVGGGPNCITCHNLVTGLSGGAPVGINFTTANSSVHYGINSNNATSQGYPTIIGACWACHDSDGNVASGHPDRYKTPKTCSECHLGSGTYNTSSYNATIVSEHYYSSMDIRTGNSTSDIGSCINCHENASEMILYSNDTDYGSFGGDGIRLNGGNLSYYHYGKLRTDMRIGNSVNCSYCHQNTSTAFSIAMVDSAYNSSIKNHSLRYNSSNPGCTATQCHSTGWLHNSTLNKSSLLLPNSTYCLSCHGSNGSGGTNYSGAVTGIKAKHNNTINCTECHLNTSKDIHPVKYLQSNASFGTTNSTGVNCISCHQNSTVYPGLTRTPPKIPNPMYHSDNTSNGTAWNTTGYWTSNSTITSCIYCHNDTKHNITALGRPADWKGDNVVNGSINTSKWCSSCHYQGYSSGGKNYNIMTSTFISSNLTVPPEITNGTYAPFNLSRYYNHSLTNYSDATCLLCHGTNISSNAGISAFLHNITWGSCTSCHYSFNAMNSTTRPERFVDSGMYNTSLHRSLSCENCHTKGHKNIGARKACEDCHVVQANPITDKDRHNITATPSTNMYGGDSVVNITLCTTCHNSALYNNSINTYGFGKSKDCDYCHTYPDKNYN